MMELALAALFFSLVYLVLFFIPKEGSWGKTACLIAFVTWLLYAAFEGLYIPWETKRAAGAVIRVDLILFIPVLIAVSIVALVGFALADSGTLKPTPPLLASVGAILTVVGVLLLDPVLIGVGAVFMSLSLIQLFRKARDKATTREPGQL